MHKTEKVKNISNQKSPTFFPTISNGQNFTSCSGLLHGNDRAIKRKEKWGWHVSLLVYGWLLEHLYLVPHDIFRLTC